MNEIRKNVRNYFKKRSCQNRLNGVEQVYCYLLHFFDNGKKARFKMKEIIDSILKAEQQAEQIVADAKVKAAKITGDGEAQVMKVNATSQEDVKNAKRSAAKAAQEEADELYAKRLAEARSEGEALVKEAEKNLDDAVNFIVGKVLG